jgi:parallel beta-helix repeat protein
LSARAALVALVALACAPNDDGGSPSVTLSVSDFGARGDGETFDTAAIQKAVDALPPGGVLRFPPGTYRIEPERGIKLKDDMRVDLGEATLVADNVSRASAGSSTSRDGGTSSSRGTLVGSRDGTPDWGIGIRASDASDLVIENVTVRNFFFDGIILTGDRGCERVAVRGVVAENNRRTGLAIVSALDVTVEDSTFASTRGQSPEAGVNGEPNRGQQVRNVSFRRCTFRGNAGGGLYLHRALGIAVAGARVEDSVAEGNAFGIVISGVSDVTIRNNRVLGHRGRTAAGIIVDDTESPLVERNRLEGNFRGIFSVKATAAEIRGNTIEGAGPKDGGNGDRGDGIVCLGSGPRDLAEGCRVTENTIRRCAGSGIYVQLAAHVRLHDNAVAETGQRGIFLRTTSASEVSGNSVSAVGGEAGATFDAIELGFGSSANTISGNVIRPGPRARQAIGICADCRDNRVTGNTVLPY